MPERSRPRRVLQRGAVIWIVTALALGIAAGLLAGVELEANEET